MNAHGFGIIVSCYRGDLPLVKGCLASIRANLAPDLPICLIAHGTFPTDDLHALYGVTVLQEHEVDVRLRAASYGYGLTKMVSFWHSPFEHFLHIDSDAVCWGDVLKGVPWQDYDLIYNEPHEVITHEIQTSQYFDPARVFPSLPAFTWQGQPFFNTGVFTARRGIFDLEEYLDLLAFEKRNPGSFLCGDQGIFNFLAFRQITEGRLKARAWPLQAVVPVMSPDELKRRFRFEDGKPVVHEHDRRLIHWAGAKPYLRAKTAFREPMVYYRLEHLRRLQSGWRHLGLAALVIEEIHVRITGSHGGSYRRALQSKIAWLWHRLGHRLRALAP